MAIAEDTLKWCNISDIKQIKVGVKVRCCLDMSGIMRSNGNYNWFTGEVTRTTWNPTLTNVVIKRDDQSNGKWQSDVNNMTLFGIQILNTDWDE